MPSGDPDTLVSDEHAMALRMYSLAIGATSAQFALLVQKSYLDPRVWQIGIYTLFANNVYRLLIA